MERGRVGDASAAVARWLLAGSGAESERRRTEVGVPGRWRCWGEKIGHWRVAVAVRSSERPSNNSSAQHIANPTAINCSSAGETSLPPTHTRTTRRPFQDSRAWTSTSTTRDGPLATRLAKLSGLRTTPALMRRPQPRGPGHFGSAAQRRSPTRKGGRFRGGSATLLLTSHNAASFKASTPGLFLLLVMLVGQRPEPGPRSLEGLNCPSSSWKCHVRIFVNLGR